MTAFAIVAPKFQEFFERCFAAEPGNFHKARCVSKIGIGPSCLTEDGLGVFSCKFAHAAIDGFASLHALDLLLTFGGSLSGLALLRRGTLEEQTACQPAHITDITRSMPTGKTPVPSPSTIVS